MRFNSGTLRPLLWRTALLSTNSRRLANRYWHTPAVLREKADRLEAIVRQRKAFDKARRRALARLRQGLDLQWTPPKSRDELHER